MKEQKYQTSSVELNYIEGANNGTPLLLLHGNMSRWQAFTPIINELAANHHLFAVDLRGHGKSSRAPGTYLLENHMQDVIEFINHKIGKPVNLFGLSLGGMIGLMASAQQPGIINKLIIGDSPLTLTTLEPIINSQKMVGLQLLELIRAKRFDKLLEELKDEKFCENISYCDIDVIDTTFFRHREMFGGFDIETILPKIKGPLLILRGEMQLGSMISDNDIQKSLSLLPSLKELQIPGVGHSLLEEKEIVLNAVSQFIVT